MQLEMMTDSRQLNLIEKTIMLFFLMYMVSYHIFSYKAETVIISEFILILLSSLLGIYFVLRNKIQIGSYFMFLCLYFLWALLTIFWAPEQQVTLTKIFTIGQICILCYLIYAYLDTKKKIEIALKMLMYSYIVLAFYTVYVYGIDKLFSGGVTDRIGSEISQINILGTSLSTGAILCFFYAYYKKTNIYYIFFALLFLLSSFTGSRKSLLVFFLGIIFLLYLKNRSKRIMEFIFKVLIVGVAVFFMLQLPMFEMVLYRMQTFFNLFTGTGKIDNSSVERSEMIALGWNLFTSNPVLGHGYDSFRYFLTDRRTYSHNNYIEMLVNGGIIAFLTYYGMYAFCIFKLSKGVKKYDHSATLLMVIVIIQLAADFAVVSYYSKITFIFLSLFFAYIRISADRSMNRLPDNIEIPVDPKEEKSFLTSKIPKSVVSD